MSDMDIYTIQTPYVERTQKAFPSKSNMYEHLLTKKHKYILNEYAYRNLKTKYHISI